MDDPGRQPSPAGHHLQSPVWPLGTSVGTPEELCFRAAPRGSWLLDPEGGIKALTSQSEELRVLELDTFFGAFSLTTWCGAARIDDVILEVKFTGTCTLKIFEDNGYDGRKLLLERRVVGSGAPQQISLDGLRGHRGILFPVFEIYAGDRFELFSIGYLTRTGPSYTPRLAIVMPTFRREDTARRNIDLIAEHVLNGANDTCRLFVIDNGQTLQLPARAGVEYIANRNFGGSGGFARGVLALREHPAAFTHMLFCDDDVMVDPQSIKRLLALLRYVPHDLVVSGGMLKMDSRQVLHEKSANVIGMHFSSNLSNQDLTRSQLVAQYDEGSFQTFCGWWFVCYPLAAGKGDFLPYPFFIGWDDVEMGRRCNRMQVQAISLLGVAIWHEEFEKKDTNWRWYYHVRNGLITSLLYDQDAQALGQSIIEIMTALLTYRYERAAFMIDGMAAVADGSSAIRDQQADHLHESILARHESRFVDARDMVVPAKIGRRLKPSRLRKLCTRLTMNGHLLPLFLFKTARDPADPGWVVEHLHSIRLVTIFRCRRVVYYERTSGKGMLCEIDHRRFYRLLGRMLWQWLRLRLRWAAARTSWRRDHEEMVSPEFWARYMGLKP